MKKITIIVISYNEKKYLEECLLSCLSQKAIDLIEIIIGDDGSDDGSIELIKEYSDKYKDIISYFVMERNETNIIPSIRVSNIIKKAIELSSCEYCICISGDDKFIDNAFILDGYDFLENDKTCSYSAVVTKRFQKFWDDGQVELIQAKRIPAKIYWMGVYVHVSCFLFRKDVLQKHLLNRFCDDTGLEYSLACGGRWKYIDKLAFGYRQRDKSIMHSADELELNILELQLFQDCLNHDMLNFYTFSRFYKALKYVYKNRNQLSDVKYKKYIINASNYENNVLEMCKNKSMKIKKMIIKSLISYIFFLIAIRFIYNKYLFK